MEYRKLMEKKMNMRKITNFTGPKSLVKIVKSLVNCCLILYFSWFKLIRHVFLINIIYLTIKKKKKKKKEKLNPEFFFKKWKRRNLGKNKMDSIGPYIRKNLK